VAVADVSEKDNQQTARLIEELGSRALAARCDVTKSEDVRRALGATVETFGRLDVAFNNAGIENRIAPTADVTEDEWDRIINIDLRGVFLCMKYEIPLMLKHGGGSIVNTASAAGLVGDIGMPAYFAAKHGVAGLTKAAALEFAQKGIRVNAVCPGVIHTPMVERILDKGGLSEEQIFAIEPMHRMGKPEEIAEAVLWLCSDASSL
jgi:NAD(P)-dependent dehydrogenase (short-subunit alcohol dehydrogenase family)